MMFRKPGHRSSAYELPRGFTLVEMLVGLALFSLVSVALYGSLQAGMRTSEAGTERADAMQELRIVSGFLRRELEDVFPLINVQKGKRGAVFEGEADWVKFAVDRPALRGPGGLYEVRIENTREDGKRVIAMSWNLLHPDLIDEEDAVQTRIIAEDLEATFSYFGRQKRTEDPEWHETWSSESETPMMVRVEFDSDVVDWPVLDAAVRVNTPKILRSGDIDGEEEDDDDEVPPPDEDDEDGPESGNDDDA
ncbi:MAG: prepilin-type N-terminal cleavage/methylation domain-containing protein [Pseudomonadota bacterium]